MDLEGMVDKHYWRAVTFLVVVILIGTGFWGLRRFHPALFLGKPDLIAVPDDQQSQNNRQKIVVEKPKLLNINMATSDELQSLPNIGQQMAQRIIQYRQEHGQFHTVDALTEVKGIGEKTLEKLKPFVDIK